MENYFEKLKCGVSNIHKEVLDTSEEVKLIKEEVRGVKKIVKTSQNFASTFEESCLPSLPVRSTEQFNQLELVLADDNEKGHLIKKLQNYGGSNLRSTVNNMMKNLMKSEVSVKFSLQGRCEKISFLPTKTCICLQGKPHILFFSN